MNPPMPKEVLDLSAHVFELAQAEIEAQMVGLSGPLAGSLLHKLNDLAQRLLAAPRLAPESLDAGAPPEWSAVLVEEGAMEATLFVGHEVPDGLQMAVELHGGVVISLQAGCGEQYGALAQGEMGPVWIDEQRASVEGEAVERLNAERRMRIEQERGELRQALEGVGGWDCAACGAFNDEGAMVCSECKAPAPPMKGGIGSLAKSAIPGLPGTRALPGSIGGSSVPNLLAGLAGMAGAMAVRAAAARASQSKPQEAPAAGPACPKCGTALQEGAKFCAHCGQALARQCPGCGAQCSAEDRFCTQCGAELHAS